MKRLTLTNLLIVANVVAYVWQTTTRGGVEYDHGYLIPKLVLDDGQWWRIVSAAFLHASIPHIGLNMLALYSLGREVEALFGKVRFAMLYAVAIVGSGLAVVWFATDVTLPTLGASGAIYGLFGALVAAGLRLGERGRAMIMQVVPVLVVNLAFTFSIPGISWQAHVGGLVTGFVAGLVLFMVARRRRVAYAFAYAGPGVETIEHPPDAGPHEEADAPPLHVRDPRE